jgi:hypothetical protein
MEGLKAEPKPTTVKAPRPYASAAIWPETPEPNIKEEIFFIRKFSAAQT